MPITSQVCYQEQLLPDSEASENAALKRSYWCLCTCMAWCSESSHPSARKSSGEQKMCFFPDKSVDLQNVFFIIFLMKVGKIQKIMALIASHVKCSHERLWQCQVLRRHQELTFWKWIFSKVILHRYARNMTPKITVAFKNCFHKPGIISL